MQIRTILCQCIKTLIKNVFLLNFTYELLMSFRSILKDHSVDPEWWGILCYKFDQNCSVGKKMYFVLLIVRELCLPKSCKCVESKAQDPGRSLCWTPSLHSLTNEIYCLFLGTGDCSSAILNWSLLTKRAL